MAPSGAGTAFFRRFACGIFLCIAAIAAYRRGLRRPSLCNGSRGFMTHAIRQLLKTPGFTIVALLTLALGIGVNTTSFSVLNRLVLRAVPFADRGRLVRVIDTYPEGGTGELPPGDFVDLRARNTVFSQVGASYVTFMSSLVEGGKPAIRCDSMYASAEYFSLLGVPPVVLGRPFSPDDERHRNHVALLTHAFWVSHFGADPRVIGQVLRSDGGAELTIIGVMNPALDDSTLFSSIVERIAFCGLMTDFDPNFRDRGWNGVSARLRPGVTMAQAQAELNILAQRLAQEHPRTNKGRGLKVLPYPTDTLEATTRNLVWLVMGLSGVVLLVACVNLANLQLVRMTGRSREFAIRMALGCSRARLIRVLLAESVILSVAGGALGALIAQWSNQFMAAYWKVNLPLDLRVLGFNLGVSALCGTIFGTLPAWFASRAEINSAIRQGARGTTCDRSRHRLRQCLIVAELAMAMTLLAGAGYFVRGIQRIAHRDLGWNPNNVVIGYMAPDDPHYGEYRDPRMLAFGERLRSELARIPGVSAAALSNDNVFSSQKTNFSIEGQPFPGNSALAYVETPSPDYFKAYGIQLLEGRDFRDSDRPGSPMVAIVSRAFAEGFWPNESPLGKRINVEDPSKPVWLTVVGVVDNITHGQDFASGPSGRLAMYVPWAQNSFRFFAMSLRVEGDPERVKEGLRKAMGRMEPNIALSYLGTADEMMSSALLQYSIARRMLLLIAGFGLLLSAVGIYGVIANLTAERTREVGIRMAVGAQPSDVMWLFLGNGMSLAFIGVGLGILGAFGLVRAFDHWIASFPGDDPRVVFSLAILLILVTVLATWLPARRAAKIDPLVALSCE